MSLPPPSTAEHADASVRPARPADVAAVAAVQAQVWRAAYGSVLPPQVLALVEAPAFEQVWRASLATPPSPQHRLLVALEGADVVGFAAVGPSADPDASSPPALTGSLGAGEVLTLGVAPNSRRMGHGSRLLNAACDTLRDEGFAAVRGWVLADDGGAAGFLVAAGMTPDGAYRDRVVAPDGSVAREVRLSADLSTR